MDWLRHRDAFVGSAVTGAGIALGVVLIVALIVGFAQVFEIVGSWS